MTVLCRRREWSRRHLETGRPRAARANWQPCRGVPCQARFSTGLINSTIMARRSCRVGCAPDRHNLHDSKRILNHPRSPMLRIALDSVLLVLLLAPAGRPAQQQPAPQKQADPQDQTEQPPPPRSSPSQQDSSASKYDPFPAEQDVEVGAFYMHKGDLDAAIDRFQDAIRLRSNFAKPRLLLAEAYEKKGDKATAVKYYKEYLKVLPDAPDRKKVRQKIEKLTTR